MFTDIKTNIMIKVIYLTCWSNPWITVAEKLRAEHGICPVYWTGYNDDNSRELVKEHFKDVIYHGYNEAWKGIFPEPIASKAKETCLNIDCLREMASQEEQAIKMIDRQDVDRFSFNFMERQRHVRNLLRSWTACIELLKPDMVITPMLPHRVYDYTLWMLCKFMKIPYIVFNHTRFSGRYMILNDFYTIGNLYLDDYRLALEKNTEQLDIPADIKDCFEKNKLDYSKAAPSYMTTEDKYSQLWDSHFKILIRTSARLIKNWRRLFSDKMFLKRWDDDYLYYKESKNVTIENSNYPIGRYLKNQFGNLSYRKKLLKYYEERTVKPDYTEPYVVYFLHYQPEATTSPTGDIFVDQSLCIDMLLKNLPSNYKVYVKEHPHQFLAHRQGHSSRMPFHYDDLKMNPRVKLMSTKESSFDLIENCKAIGTVCGTVGWESMVRGRPVILFGLSWYENYDKGVLRITDEASAKRMQDFIEGYRYDEHSLLAYLEAVGKNSKIAYYYKATGKNTINITEQECVDNLVGSIVDIYDKTIKSYNE